MSPRMHGGEVVGRMLLRPFCTKDLCSRLLRAMSGRGRCCLVSFLPSNKAPGGHRVFFGDDDDSLWYRKGCDLFPTYSVSCFVPLFLSRFPCVCGDAGLA